MIEAPKYKMSAANQADLGNRLCAYLSKKFSRQLGTEVKVRIFDAPNKGYVIDCETVIEIRMPTGGLEAVKMLDLEL